MRALILLVASLAAGGAASAADLYVSPAGRDTWSGTLPAPNRAGTDGPFATLQRAQNAARAERHRPATVHVRAGTYSLPETLVFTPEDSGATYKAYAQERPLLSGGRVVAGWKPVPGSNPRAWTAEIPEARAGAWYFRQLWAARKGESVFTRRFRPHKGMLAIAGLTYSPARKTMAHRAAQQDFRFFPGDLQAFHNLKDVEVVALHSWSASRLKVADLDPERRVVKFTSVPTFRIGAWYSGGRNPYYVENVREELKHPGEWYLDRTTGVLTYLPLPGESPENTTFVAPVLEKMVVLKGDAAKGQFVENLRFEGLRFAHTEWPVPDQGYDVSQGQPLLPAAIEAVGARDCAFTRCTLSNTGAYGIGLGVGCARDTVSGCLFYDMGGGGVKVGDSSMSNKAVAPLLPTDNAVENNLITDTGVMHFSANGIWCGIVKGTRIRHNEVRRNPYTGIAVGWCWGYDPTSCAGNVIEANHVHHVMQLVQDGGGIYTLGWQPGTVVRGNVIHDNRRSPFACADGQIGLYFDEGSKGFAVEENVVYDVAWENCKIAQNQNKPDDHVFRNNTLAVPPGDPRFPREIAARAGLEPAFRDLDDRGLRVTPNPVYAMMLPSLPPVPVGLNLDFEEIPVGECPNEFSGAGFTAAAGFAVTEETASAGRRCLKIQDAAGLARTFYPYATYGGYQVEKGQVTLSFDVMQNAGKPGDLSVEFRDYATKREREFHSGPSLVLTPEGKLLAGGKEVAMLPAGGWSRVEMAFPLGAGAAKECRLTVTLPDKTTRTAQVPFAHAEFAVATSLYLIAGGDGESVTYLDNVRLGVK